MNLRQLKYFVRVVQLGSLTRAAEALHVAQPALSQQMALLESKLNVKLLIRGQRGVQPTVEGELLFRHAQTILRQVEYTHSLMSRASDHITGTVSIGLASSTARILALPLMRRVKQELPAIVLELVDLPSADLTKFVLQGRIDFSLSPDQSPLNGIDQTLLLREELLLLTPPTWNLPSQPEIRDIASLPLLLPSSPNTLRSRLDQAFLTTGNSINLYGEASTSAILIPSVLAGLAATILPYSAAHVEIPQKLCTAHSMHPPLFRDLSLCLGTSLPTTPAVLQVVDLCKEEISRLVNEGSWRHADLLFA